MQPRLNINTIHVFSHSVVSLPCILVALISLDPLLLIKLEQYLYGIRELGPYGWTKRFYNYK